MNPGLKHPNQGAPAPALPKPRVVYVSFSAEINPNTTETLVATMSNIVAQGATGIYPLLSTPGGAVMNGLNLYNVLRGLPIPLTTHNVGNVDSIGDAVFLAGATRYTCPHSTFMFHGVSCAIPASMTSPTGPVAIQGPKELREKLDGLEADQRRIGSIIKERTRLDEAVIQALFLEAQTKNADFALASGFVSEIRDVQIPAGAPVISLVFKR